MEEEKISVYIKTDENGNITEINSDIFLHDLTDCIKVDEGVGDKFAHAQNCYLDRPLFDENGIFNFRYADGKVIRRTDEEKKPALDRIKALREISELKQKLHDTDYHIIKVVEGAATLLDCAAVVAERAKWRKKINELEGML